MKENDSLLSCKRNVTSQTGEDGIIENIFMVIGEGNKWCVEFGAWDGKHFSNTYNLIANKGWSGILIESDFEKYKQLLETYKDNSRVIYINRFVDFEGSDSIDNILAGTPIPISFDLLSIDIDGNDYHIWESMATYLPRVVVIEFNPTIPNDIEFIQPKNMKVNQGSSLFSLTKLGNTKGYELVAATELNALFVRKEYFKLFDINDNSLSALHKGREFQTRLFQLYDGTIVLEGYNKLFWHGKEIRQEDVQVQPRFLRFFPDRRLKVTDWRILFRALMGIEKRIHKYIYYVNDNPVLADKDV
jgi:hypothetical protein